MERNHCGPRLIVICGLPGSGKTTAAQWLERQLGAVRLSADEWMAELGINLWDEAARARIESLQWKLTQQFLTAGLIVIIEWGTWGRDERDLLRLGARKLGAAVELHYLSAPLDVLWERIRSRGLEDPPITRELLEGWCSKFHNPTPEEMLLFDAPLATAPWPTSS